MLRINFNPTAAAAQRFLGANAASVQGTTRRLASGLRVNSAADDAAGLALGLKTRAQAQGMSQARRNLQDGISLIQVAEGALEQINGLLQRMRELAVQSANGVLSDSDRRAMQVEVDQAVAEIERIGASVKFNGKNILGASETTSKERDLMWSLRNSWLRSAEDLIDTYYGLRGDGAAIKMFGDPVGGNPLAYVSASFDAATGRSVSGTIELHVNMNNYADVSQPNGAANPTGSTSYLDRTIVHEMTHAVMGRTMRMAGAGAVPSWFVEGTAEFMAGADERLWADTTNQTNIANVMTSGWNTAWTGTSAQYSAGYAAVKYLNSKLLAANKTMIDFMNVLESPPAGAGSDIDKAFAATLGAPLDSLADFEADFLANGTAFIAGLDLDDADVGAIGGGDASLAAPDIASDPTDPLRYWAEEYNAGENVLLSLQVGANSSASDRLDLSEVRISAADAGVAVGADLTTQSGARALIDRLDGSIVNVSAKRAVLGAMHARLDHSLTALGAGIDNMVAAEGRILDADVAAEVAALTRAQLLQRTGINILTATQRSAPSVLTLLR